MKPGPYKNLAKALKKSDEKDPKKKKAPDKTFKNLAKKAYY